MKNLLKSCLLISAISCNAIAGTSDMILGCPGKPCVDPGTGRFRQELPNDLSRPIELEQNKYDLTCKVGEVCFEQGLKNAGHNFHLAPGAVVRLEVKTKNGASITMQSGSNTMSASYLSVGTGVPKEQIVQLEGNIDKTGNFTVDVQVAKIIVNGKPQNVDSGVYSLKITRTGAAKQQEEPGNMI